MTSVIGTLGVTVSETKASTSMFSVEDDGSMLVLNHTTIRDNSNEGSWSAVYVGDEAEATIYRSQFLRNSRVAVSHNEVYHWSCFA